MPKRYGAKPVRRIAKPVRRTGGSRPTPPKKVGGVRKSSRKAAYPRVGTGEDYPNRRPGTRVGETSTGQKRLQPSRATQKRRTTKSPFPNRNPSRGWWEQYGDRKRA